jgi:transcriptional regulator with XRE-family HTH domain/plasmid stabilization system protein ParE
MVTQRLLKAWLAKAPQPYSEDDLNAIAVHCTLMEDNARKVEREMQKRIAAVVLHPRIGQSFPAIVTGVNKYGTFVRTLDPHVDGMVVQRRQGAGCGRQGDGEADLHRPAAGFIDFAAEGSIRGLDRDLSQQETVRAIEAETGSKLSQSYLSQIESGARPHLTNTTRQILATFFKVHPGYLVDDPEGYHPELQSELRGLEDKLDLWLVAGAERFRRDPELMQALLTLARHERTRECLLLLEAILETPGLMPRLAEVLRPKKQGLGNREQGTGAPEKGSGRGRKEGARK